MIEVKVPAKCILAGEHAVLRGFPAIVLPIPSLYLSICSVPCEPGAEVISPDLLRGIFEKILGRDIGKLNGLTIQMKSMIPSGAGLGSSAALSVAALRWTHESGFWKGDLFTKALELEDQFHGRSSGIDLAGVMASGPILFRMGPHFSNLPKLKLPYLLLTDTGTRCPTRGAVEKVQQMKDASLDQQMGRATELLHKAFISGKMDLEPWIEAFTLAKDCFYRWDLVSTAMAEKERYLLSSGAKAVKPTGSGGGGFLLSLWDHPPPEPLGIFVQ
jgi:mevalonate kinase